MVRRETPPGRRALAWAGTWLCSFALFPVLVAWTGFFHPRHFRGLSAPGDPRFWHTIGLCAVAASLLTAQLWGSRNKPVTHRAAPPTARGRMRQVLGVAVFLFFMIVQIMAGHRGPAPNWAGVLGGALALALLVWLLLRCAAAAIGVRPAPSPVPAAETPLAGTPPPPAAPWVQPPPNRYRAEATAREVVCRRPAWQQTGLGCMALMVGLMSLSALAFALAGLGLWLLPGMTLHSNGWFTFLMLCCWLAIGGLTLMAVSLLGPRELRVSPADRTYTFRTSAPLPAQLAALVGSALGNARPDAGLPWRTRVYTGPCSDMAGVALGTQASGRETWYLLWLCWTPSAAADGRPLMRLGYVRSREAARALQAQAAADLGVPVLPDEAFLSQD